MISKSIIRGVKTLIAILVASAALSMGACTPEGSDYNRPGSEVNANHPGPAVNANASSNSNSARTPVAPEIDPSLLVASLEDQEFVDQTTQRLAVYLGPVAKVVARKAAQKAGTQQEFVQLVAGHLGAQERGEFLRELGFDDAV